MDNESLKKAAIPAQFCERCGNSFDCRAGDIQNCACSGIKITGKEMADIKARYNDCLCVHCLREITTGSHE